MPEAVHASERDGIHGKQVGSVGEYGEKEAVGDAMV